MMELGPGPTACVRLVCTGAAVLRDSLGGDRGREIIS